MVLLIGKLRVPFLILSLALFNISCASNGGSVSGNSGSGPVAEAPQPTPEEPEDVPPAEDEPATLPELNACKKYDRVAKKKPERIF